MAAVNGKQAMANVGSGSNAASFRDEASIRVRIDNKTFPAVGERPPQEILKDVTFDVEPRSFLILTGPSGCGKSTLLNIIAGLDKDFEGDINLGSGADKMTYIFQSPRLLPWRTVYENIALVMPETPDRDAKIKAMLARVGLDDAANAYPEMLSLGMQRRVSLARGFILEPEILLMDEPFVSLDDPTAESLRALVRDLWHAQPTTVIFVTHDRSEAIQLGTRILRLAPGQASIAADIPVTLTAEQRHDPAAIAQAQARIFEGT